MPRATRRTTRRSNQRAAAPEGPREPGRPVTAERESSLSDSLSLSLSLPLSPPANSKHFSSPSTVLNRYSYASCSRCCHPFPTSPARSAGPPRRADRPTAPPQPVVELIVSLAARPSCHCQTAVSPRDDRTVVGRLLCAPVASSPSPVLSAPIGHLLRDGHRQPRPTGARHGNRALYRRIALAAHYRSAIACQTPGSRLAGSSARQY